MNIDELRAMLIEYLETIGDSPWNIDRQEARKAIEAFLKWLEARR